jgi:hypothetical protein
MADATDSTTEIQLRLDRLRAGDDSARDELLDITRARLGRLARKMLLSKSVPDHHFMSKSVSDVKVGVRSSFQGSKR